MKGGYCGMSEVNVKKVLDQSATYQRLNARFANSVPIQLIRAKEVHDRHQVDLVDMQKLKVLFNGKSYQYIMSLCDVFSKFV